LLADALSMGVGDALSSKAEMELEQCLWAELRQAY